jgi:hypothetical protein
VRVLVKEELSTFTDYLNFFELVAFLADTKQLGEKDVMSLFNYYLKCLKRHTAVRDYLSDSRNGFEHLTGFLDKTEL